MRSDPDPVSKKTDVSGSGSGSQNLMFIDQWEKIGKNPDPGFFRGSDPGPVFLEGSEPVFLEGSDPDPVFLEDSDPDPAPGQLY